MSDVTSSHSVNLGLAVLPETEDPKLFPEFMRMYNAIKLTMNAVDVYTGALPPEGTDREEYNPGQALANLSRLHKIYLTAGETISSGSICCIRETGEVFKDTTTLGLGESRSNYIMYSLEDMVAGDLGAFSLYGVLEIPDPYFLPGTTYWASDSGALVASTALDRVNPIGVALTAYHLLFQPDLYHVEPSP